MEHTEQCIKAQEEFKQLEAAYAASWPNSCKSCEGTGQIVFSQSVPYGSTSASFDVCDPCESCTGKGLCARCGQPGLTDEGRGDESTGDGPCRFCNWNYDNYPPSQPECFCWEQEEYNVATDFILC